MSGDTLKRVKSVKRWLEKAENSYSNHKELTGEMNLIMAQAEMQRLKEVRGTSPRRKWLLGLRLSRGFSNSKTRSRRKTSIHS